MTVGHSHPKTNKGSSVGASVSVLVSLHSSRTPGLHMRMTFVPKIAVPDSTFAGQWGFSIFTHRLRRAGCFSVPLLFDVRVVAPVGLLLPRASRRSCGA
jgi:hypothetical protein